MDSACQCLSRPTSAALTAASPASALATARPAALAAAALTAAVVVTSTSYAHAPTAATAASPAGATTTPDTTTPTANVERDGRGGGRSLGGGSGQRHARRQALASLRRTRMCLPRGESP